jgi:hypothetical protein
LAAEGHLHQMTNINLPLQGGREVVVIDVGYLGYVDSNFDERRHGIDY